MQDKLLEGIVSDIAGKSGLDILNLLLGKKDVNEFLLAKKLKLTINQIRNILYRLSNYSLVTFTRKKDKKKGWYTYFWTLDNEKALELLDSKIKKETDSLKSQLKSRETKRFYTCKVCKTEISEETALTHSFTCQECGDIYELAENKKLINDLRGSIARLERRRQVVLEELGKIKEVKGKKREKDANRADTKKRKLREKQKKARQKIKNKINKKVKKKVKKSKKKKIKKFKKKKL